ncbi:MAG: alcohol dehydrogenase catalytic domain-containing protein [Methanobrevibacter wolinii]|nr:alcohol dehydrogenase catalytic domain-containing protein [Methanobrevibacter wolinii]
MLNTIYRLVSPRTFEECYEDMDISKDVIIRPTHFSICHADQRYYQGLRNPKILNQKLPMALIHESIGIVVKDNTNTFKKDDKVVMIPNTPIEKDEIISENYLKSSKFRSSGYDGFMQELVQMKKDRILKIPDNINLDVLSFTELISVAIHSINRFKKFSHERKNKIGIWGDGNLSFILSLLLKIKFPNSELYVFGKHSEKLNLFSFVKNTYLINEIPEDLTIDHAFECTGGVGCETSINQIIDYIKPEGTISLLGVSENKIPLNTRLILEKGLILFGSSRSTKEDFEETLYFLSNNKKLVDYLENLVSNVIEVKTLKDINKAFILDKESSFGKTIIHWNH